MAQIDITEFVQSVTIEDQPVSFIALEIGKLHVEPGDVLTVRRVDGLDLTREESAQVRKTVLQAFDGAAWQPPILFVDGFELAVIRAKEVGDG